MSRVERHAVVGTGALVAVAAVVVFSSILTPAPHTGGDNAGYLSLAHSLATGNGYTELWDPSRPAHNKYPPVFPLVLGGLVLAGASGWMAFKLLMASLMVFSVVLVFTWTADRTGALGAAGITILTLFSAGWLDASRWILSEPAFLGFSFLSLWAVGRSGVEGPKRREDRAVESEGEAPAPAGWLVLACLSAGLAFFTRSAGLPLVLALAGTLLLVGRFRALAWFALCLSIPAGWWLIRVRTGGVGAYQSEFWMANPYDPTAGTISWSDLPARVWTNLRLYVSAVLPGEWWVRAQGAALAGLGVSLAGLSVWGWFARIRQHRGMAELFAPLYLGLILLWPEVWSGERFLLPLYPLILLYASDSVTRLGRTAGSVGASLAAAGAFLLLLVPALPGWISIAGGAATCRRTAASGDPLACQGSAFVEFRNAALWSGVNLPTDAVVLSRKPRLLYLFGGPPGRVFPFTRDPDDFLAEADRIGAGYLVLDHIDNVSLFYLPAILGARPLAFCHVAGWGGTEAGPGTQLFAILPSGARRQGGTLTDLRSCPPGYRTDPEVQPNLEPKRIPRLTLSEETGQTSMGSRP